MDIKRTIKTMVCFARIYLSPVCNCSYAFVDSMHAKVDKLILDGYTGMLRTCAGIDFNFATALDLSRTEQITNRCASSSELPTNISTMAFKCNVQTKKRSYNAFQSTKMLLKSVVFIL